MVKAIQIPYNDLFELKCRLAAQAGFRDISIGFTELLGKTEYEWAQITDDIIRILEENALHCVQSHPYYYDLFISSEKIDDACEFAINQAIIASGKLGASWCAIHPRSSISSGSYHARSFEDNKRVFSNYLETAIKYGTGITAENLLIDGDIKPAIPFYCSNYDDLWQLADSFHDEHMGVCWDFGHANMMFFDQETAIAYLGNLIKCTHIHNNFKTRDSHLTPDQGNIAWDRAMPALASIGYDGPLTLEVHCCYQDSALMASFAKHCYTCLIFLENLMKSGQL